MAVIVTIALLAVFFFYSLLILYYWRSWLGIPVAQPVKMFTPVKVSVIIAARNEEEHIGKLLQALQQQAYPREQMEVIVVDDHSTDRTAAIVAEFPWVRLLQLKDEGINAYKKKAVALGIFHASGELILTTDADCLPGNEWLKTLVSFRNNTNAGLVVAPVTYTAGSGIVEIFQAIDFMVLQGITGASVYKRFHSMCNGANLLYEKKLFDEVNGFSGIDHIASGDDMLLMHKISQKYPERIRYIKSPDAIVTTRPMPDWQSFFNQRIRWASKAAHYDDKRIIAVLILVYVFNLSFPGLAIAGFWSVYYWWLLLLLWIGKTMVELPFVYSLTKFFGHSRLLKYFFFFQPLHIVYTIVSGFFGQFGRYQWKGRRVW